MAKVDHNPLREMVHMLNPQCIDSFILLPVLQEIISRAFQEATEPLYREMAL